jgi:hypothetical protein
MYEEMRLKKNGVAVRVYDITDGMATIFDPALYQRQNNGWTKVNTSKLVPMDFPINCDEYISKTKKNKAKSRMTLVNTSWQTTDGIIWGHDDIEGAIAHELELMEEESKKENTNNV